MTRLQETVEERGFAIVADLIPANEIVDLSAEFSQASLQRSRAGVRHALKLPSVAALANGSRLVGIAQDILGGEAVPFRATLFDKSKKRTGSLRGIKIQLCRCAREAKNRDGGRGP